MNREPPIRVVLGEAERSFGLLQFILEGEGIDIVGRAGDDAELVRLLRDATPSVVVLDAGISATAASHARELAPSAALIVVWPRDAIAVMADDRIDPERAVNELGDVVRRVAATRRRAPARIRDVEERGVMPIPIDVDDAVPLPSVVRRRRRRHPVLAAVAMLAFYTLTLSTIAVAITGGFDVERGRPSPSEVPRPGAPAWNARMAPRSDSVGGAGSIPTSTLGDGSERRGAPDRSGSGPGDERSNGHGNVTRPGNSGQGNSGQGNSGQGNSGQGNSGQGNGSEGNSGQGDGTGNGGHGDGNGNGGQGNGGQGNGEQGNGGQGNGGQGNGGQGNGNGGEGNGGNAPGNDGGQGNGDAGASTHDGGHDARPNNDDGGSDDAPRK